ncbi:MAG: hypothetical protein ACKO24_04670 [Leptolyngbyaceae cyanobacterium]
MTAQKIPWISLTLLLFAYTTLGWDVSGPHFPRPQAVVKHCEASLAQTEALNSLHPGLRSLAEGKAPAIAEPAEPSGEPSAAHKKAPQAAEQQPDQPSTPGITAPPTEFQRHPRPRRRLSLRDIQSSLCRLSLKYNLPIILAAVVWIVVAAIAFMNPLVNFSRFITRWFQSDTVAFLTICIVAGTASMMLFWLHVFLQILTIIAAETLARLDLQLSRLNNSQAFWILLMVSFVGLASGLTLRFVVSY